MRPGCEVWLSLRDNLLSLATSPVDAARLLVLDLVELQVKDLSAGLASVVLLVFNLLPLHILAQVCLS